MRSHLKVQPIAFIALHGDESVLCHKPAIRITLMFHSSKEPEGLGLHLEYMEANHHKRGCNDAAREVSAESLSFMWLLRT